MRMGFIALCLEFGLQLRDVPEAYEAFWREPIASFEQEFEFVGNLQRWIYDFNQRNYF